MDTKTRLGKFNKNEYLVFVLTITKIYDIIKPLINKMPLTTFISRIDWFDVGISAATLWLLYSALKGVRLLKEKLIADTQSLDKKIADWNTIVTTQISDFNIKFDEYVRQKGSIDTMMMRDYSTCLQAFIAFLNSFTDPKDLDAIANILFERKIQIVDCERIGMSVVLVASMRKLYHADEMQKQDDILK